MWPWEPDPPLIPLSAAGTHAMALLLPCCLIAHFAQWLERWGCISLDRLPDFWLDWIWASYGHLGNAFGQDCQYTVAFSLIAWVSLLGFEAASAQFCTKLLLQVLPSPTAICWHKACWTPSTHGLYKGFIQMGRAWSTHAHSSGKWASADISKSWL